jgi:hypothetical protein
MSVSIGDDEVVTGTGPARALYDAIVAEETSYQALPSLTPPSNWKHPPQAWIDTAQVARLRILRGWARRANAHAAGIGYVDTGIPKTGAYNAVIGDYVRVDPSGGGFAITLPAITAANKNQGITAKNVTSSTNAVTFSTTGGATMDGLASGAVQIDTDRGHYTFISNGDVGSPNWDVYPTPV